MAKECAMLPQWKLLEIVRTCGTGWMRRHERVKPADNVFWQRSRVENYALAIELAAAHVPPGNQMTKDRKDAVWLHVCTEVDLMLKNVQVN
ncbi:MAG: hypothetical protein ACK5SP_00140 [bacterium]